MTRALFVRPRLVLLAPAALNLALIMVLYWLSYTTGPTPRAVFLPIGAIVLAAVGLLAAEHVTRSRRLEGTVLVCHGLLGTRRVDLSTASVWLRFGRLFARAGDERRVKIPVEILGKGALPPADLRALADAIAPGAESARTAEPETSSVVSWLHQLATDPAARDEARRRQVRAGRVQLVLSVAASALFVAVMLTRFGGPIIG